MKYQLTLYHKSFIVEKLGKRISVHTLEAPGEKWEFTLEPNASPIQLIRDQERFFAKIGAQHVTGTWEPIQRGVDAAAFDGTIKSPFAGRVTKCAVAPGGPVEAGDLLMVIEAMKMEYPVTAPRAGTVEAVLVRVGDQVALDEVVAKLKP